MKTPLLCLFIGRIFTFATIACAFVCGEAQGRAGIIHTPSVRSQHAAPRQQTSKPLRSALRWTFRVPARANALPPVTATSVVTAERVVVETADIGGRAHTAYGLRRKDGGQIWQTDNHLLPSLMLSPLHSENVVFFVPNRYENAQTAQAVEVATGHELWQRTQADVCRILIGVYGDVTAFADAARRQVQLVHTRTGQMLDAKREDDKRLITSAMWAHGGAIQTVDVNAQPCLLDLQNGTLAPVPLTQIVPAWKNPEITPGSVELVLPFANEEGNRRGLVNGGSIIVRVDEDNGMAGHSVWPKYLAGMGQNGARLWQFPAHISPPDKYDFADRIQAAWPVEQAGIVIAQNQQNTLFGVSMGSGKQGWQRDWRGRMQRHTGRGLLQSVAVYDRGVFALSIPDAQLKREDNRPTAPFAVRRRLDYVDARTGATYHIADLTLDTTQGDFVPVTLSVHGDELFAATPDAVRAYHCRDLLRQAPEPTPALKQILAQLPPRYTLTMLDSLPRDPECRQSGTQALAINNTGQVVGVSWEHPVTWQNGKLRRLPTLPGDNVGAAYAINNRGDILSHSERRFLSQALLLAKSGAVLLHGLGGRQSRPVAFNTRHEVVGYATLTPDGSGQTVEHPVLWRDGQTIDLGLLPGYHAGRATALNDRGQVVGFCYNGSYDEDTVPPKDERAWLWDNGKLTELGTLPGYTSSRAEAINNRGQIVGTAGKNEAPVQRGRAWTWQAGQMRDLGALDAGVSNALFINDAGVIAGRALTHTRYDEGESDFWQPVRWQSGTDGKIELLRVPGGIETGEPIGMDSQGRLVIHAWGYSKKTAGMVFWTWENGQYARLTLPEASAHIQTVAPDGALLIFASGPGPLDKLRRYLWNPRSGNTRNLPAPSRQNAPNDWNPLALNAAGDVIGTIAPAYFPMPHDMLLQQGKIVTFPTPNPKIVTALTGLNNGGQVIGQWTLAGDVAANDPFRRTFASRPFVWQNGVTTWLNPKKEPPLLSSAQAINDRGQILATIGNSDPSAGSNFTDGPVLWENGQARKLDTLNLEPTAFNNTGLIVGKGGGIAQNADDHAVPYHAPAVWRQGREIHLTEGWAGDEYGARAVNRNGQVVGDSNQGAFVWQAGRLFPLTGLLPRDSGWTLSVATGINDRGQIVGYGQYYAGRDQQNALTYYVTRAFLLTPTSF